jgi:microcystin-dependent protein
MAQPYVGEIRIFAGNFAPAGWLLCNGQLLPISENETLFQLIGTTYGGDGQSTFALPDLRGRIPLHMGQGAGLQNYQLAEAAGVEEVALTVNPARFSQANIDPFLQDDPTANMAATAISTLGGSQPHTNFQPYICINYIISLFGIYPSVT